MILPILIIAPSGARGRGVFTTAAIPANTVIEISPVIVLSAKDRKQAEKTLLFDYIFEWGRKNKKGCIALGYLSVYNHSYQANCEYEMDFDQQLMTVKTLRPIERGEELFFNYNATEDEQTPVWFKTV
jgi:SET domain-containing protein